MLVWEYKTGGTPTQYQKIDEAIRTAQFVRNKAIRFWMDTEGAGKYALSGLSKLLAAEFPFAQKLNSTARQASCERAWAAISRFYDNCKKHVPGQKGYPKFQKECRSVEYKQSGWKLSTDCNKIAFTDGHNIGSLKLVGTRDLSDLKDSIKRVRLIRRADGYYVQFVIDANRQEDPRYTGEMIGLDVGLRHFMTDSGGNTIENPRFLRKAEKALKRLQRAVSHKKKGSVNRKKARRKLARKHLKVSRQRNDFATKLARCVVQSNDLIAVEDLQIRNMVKNHHLAKAISDAAWGMFRAKLTYYGKLYGKVVVAVPPQFTSQNCSRCGKIVKKSLSTRTHVCSCGLILDRDHNAARNILSLGVSALSKTTAGHAGSNASGEMALCLVSATI